MMTMAILERTKPYPKEESALGSTSTKEQLYSLSFMRFFAASLVVCIHFFLLVWPGGAKYVASVDWRQLVTFFFVLSGFILAYVYPELNGLTAIAKFIRARLARIYPTYLLGLGLMLLIAPPRHLLTDFQILSLNLAMVQSWLPCRVFFMFFNAPAWSVSSDFTLYLLFPFLIANFARSWKIKLSLAFALFTFLCFFGNIVQGVSSNTYYELCPDWFSYISPLSRMFEFTLGMCAGTLFLKHRQHPGMSRTFTSKWEICLLVACGLFFFSPYLLTLIPGHDRFSPPLTQWATAACCAPLHALVIYVFARQTGALSNFFASKQLIFLGNLSMPVYLLHYPLISCIGLHFPFFTELPRPMYLFGYFSLLLALSFLCFEFLEKPSRALVLGHGFTGFPPKLTPVHALAFASVTLIGSATWIGLAHTHL
jgi:peptidoglycan/LPS O-acetylase OafA/YrhL